MIFSEIDFDDETSKDSSKDSKLDHSMWEDPVDEEPIVGLDRVLPRLTEERMDLGQINDLDTSDTIFKSEILDDKKYANGIFLIIVYSDNNFGLLILYVVIYDL